MRSSADALSQLAGSVPRCALFRPRNQLMLSARRNVAVRMSQLSMTNSYLYSLWLWDCWLRLASTRSLSNRVFCFFHSCVGDRTCRVFGRTFESDLAFATACFAPGATTFSMFGRDNLTRRANQDESLSSPRRKNIPLPSSGKSAL